MPASLRSVPPDRDRRRRGLAFGGILGPLGFAGAWLIGSLQTPGYSMRNDAISRLAASGADTRPLMTAGFLVFGIGAAAFGLTLREIVDGPAWMAAVVTGVATLGVAAFPLDVSHTIDLAHGAAATLGYGSLAALPLLAVGPLKRAGARGAAIASRVVGVASAACLAATVAGPAHGLFQRLGVSVGDAWIAAAAWAILADRMDLSGRSRRA